VNKLRICAERAGRPVIRQPENAVGMDFSSLFRDIYALGILVTPALHLKGVGWGLQGGCEGVPWGLPLPTLRQPYGNPKATLRQPPMKYDQVWAKNTQISQKIQVEFRLENHESFITIRSPIFWSILWSGYILCWKMIKFALYKKNWHPSTTWPVIQRLVFFHICYRRHLMIFLLTWMYLLVSICRLSIMNY